MGRRGTVVLSRASLSEELCSFSGKENFSLKASGDIKVKSSGELNQRD